MWDRGIFRQAIIGIVCSLLVIDSGLNEGWSTPIIPKFNHEDPLNITEDNVAWVVNLMYVGVGFGSIVPFVFMDRIGRKGTLLVATIPKSISWIVIGIADSVPLLFFGRILAGVGCGITYSVMPMYIGEVTTKRTRGPLGTLMAVLLNSGMLLAYGIGLSTTRFTMAMICLMFPITFALTFVWLPESSVFLTRKNKLTSAERTLKWSLGKENVDEEFEEIKRIVATEEQPVKLSFSAVIREACVRRENRRAFGIAMILMSALTLTGIAPIAAYQSYIFKESGFEISMNLGIVMTGCASVLAGATCVLLVRTTGKRLLLLISAPIVTLSLMVLAIFFTLLSSDHDVSKYRWIPMVFLLSYIFSYGFALNPIPLAYTGEIFRVEVKVPAAILCSLYYAITSTGTVKFYQVIQGLYGTHAPLWTFTTITFFLWVLIYRYVPETEGKTLGEIQVELRGKK